MIFKQNNFVTLLTCLSALLVCGCSNDGSSSDQESPAALHAALRPKLTNTIATVSYPLEYLTQRIAGTGIKVFCPAVDVVKGRNWQPTSAEVASMQAADLIIANGPGASYADWLNRVSVSDDKLFNSASALPTKDFIMVQDYKVVHQHGPEGEHSHPYMVAHTWLDPSIAKKQATRIASALNGLYPEKAEAFTANLKALDEDLDRLSNQLAAIAQLASEKGKDSIKVITINPTLKFLTRAAGIDDRHLLWFDDDGQPKQQFETALKDVRGESEGSVHLLIPANVELGMTEALGSDYANRYNVQVHFIDAFDKAPQEGDYLSFMEANIKQLREIVEE